MKYTPEDKSRWWQEEIKAGRRTKTDLKLWLQKNQKRLTQEELALLVFLGSETVKAPRRWDKWRAGNTNRST